MTTLYKLNSDRSVAVDINVSFYDMESCPFNAKVQLLTEGGIAIYGRLKFANDKHAYKGWRPVPSVQGDVNVG